MALTNQFQLIQVGKKRQPFLALDSLTPPLFSQALQAMDIWSMLNHALTLIFLLIIIAYAMQFITICLSILSFLDYLYYSFAICTSSIICCFQTEILDPLSSIATWPNVSSVWHFRLYSSGTCRLSYMPPMSLRLGIGSVPSIDKGIG
jgi:hypothetical protein